MAIPNLYKDIDGNFYSAHSYAEKNGLSIRKSRRILKKAVKENKMVFFDRLSRRIKNKMPVTDPRAENCRKFYKSPDGVVRGIELVYEPNLAAKYELVSVAMFDKTQSGGNHVITYVVLDENNVPIPVIVSLAWPYPTLTNYAVPGNPNRQHIVENKIVGRWGPLAVCIVENGEKVSDVIGGFGLPEDQHVSFDVVFRRRSKNTPAPPVTPLPPVDETAKAIEALHNTLKIIGKHFGAPV